MVRGSDTSRSEIDFAGIALGIGDELRNALGRKRRIYYEHVGHAPDTRDRRDIANEIEIELVVERCVDQVRGSYHQKRMTVRRRARDCLSSRSEEHTSELQSLRHL